MFLNLLLLFNLVTFSSCNQETEFETVIVSSSDSIQVGVSTDTGSIGDLAPSFEFKNLIAGANYEIHGDSTCSSLVSSFSANVEDDRVIFKIPEASLIESKKINFHLKGKATGGETFCINLNKEFTFIKNDLENDITIALGNNLNAVDNSSSVSLAVSGLNSNRIVELFTDSQCSSRSSSITDYQSMTVPENSNSISLNFKLSAPGSFNFYIKVTNPASNVSICTDSSVSYVFDNIPPTITSLMFESNLSDRFQSFNNRPTIKLMGGFSIRDEIRVFSDNSCSDQIASSSITPGSESSTTIELDLSLSSGASQDISVLAIDTAGNISSCTGPITYTKLADSEPTLNPSANSSGNLTFEFPDLTLTTDVLNTQYEVKIYPETNDCTGANQTETMTSSKSVTFSNVFPTPGIYSSFSVQLTKDGVTDQTNCYSSFNFRTLSSSAVSLGLPSSSSAGRDLDFTISGIQEAGTIYLYQNSGCFGSAWGAGTVVDGSLTSISIDNRSISLPGNYNFSAKLTASGGVDTGCSDSISHTVYGVSSSWSNSTVEPGFGDSDIFANLSWDFLSGDTIKFYDESSCGGSAVYTHSVSSPSSSLSINLQPYLNSGVNTTFSYEINGDRGCESQELVFNLLESSLSTPGGNSGEDPLPVVKVNSLPLNRRLDFELYNTSNCSGSADVVVNEEKLTSDNFYNFLSSGRTSLSNIGPNSFSVKLKLYNASESANVERCLGTTSYSLLPTAPTNLSVAPSGTAGELNFSNSENLTDGKLIIYSGSSCNTELGVVDYSGGVANFSSTFSSEGSYTFSAKRRKVVSSINYDSTCSGELASSTIDLTSPGSFTTLSFLTTDNSKLTYGSVDLDFRVEASNFEVGEKLSLYPTSNCTGSSLTINDGGTPKSALVITDSGITSYTLKHSPGNYPVGSQSVYVLREDPSGNKNCHSSTPVNTPFNFTIFPRIEFNESTTANPGFGSNVNVQVGYSLSEDQILSIFKSSDCSGLAVSTTTLEAASNSKDLNLSSFTNSSEDTNFSFSFDGGSSCLPNSLTYELIDLLLSFPNGVSGLDARPEVKISGDMTSIWHLYLYQNETCSGTYSSRTTLSLGEDGFYTFESDHYNRSDLEGIGPHPFTVCTYLKTLDGESIGGYGNLGTITYNFLPTAATALTVSAGTNLGDVNFSNSENLDGGALVVYSGTNCDTELGSANYTSGVANYSHNFSSEGTYQFSVKRRKVISGINYDSACSGALASYSVDLTPEIEFDPTDTVSPGLGNKANVLVRYNVPINRTLDIYKNTNCSGTKITSQVLSSSAFNTTIDLVSYLETTGDTNFSFKFAHESSCLPGSITYKRLNLFLRFPNGNAGNETKPDIQLSGDSNSESNTDMTSILQLDLYPPNSSCSGSPDFSYASLNLSDGQTFNFGALAGREALSTNGNNSFSIYIHFKTIDGSYSGEGFCLGPVTYDFDNTPPGNIASFSIDGDGGNRAFENNINFSVKLDVTGQADFEIGEVVTLHGDSGCSGANLITRAVDSSDISNKAISFNLTQEHINGFNFNFSNYRINEKKIYVKRTDQYGNFRCFNNEGNNEVLSLFIHQTPSLTLNHQGTPITSPTDENNLRFSLGNMPQTINSSTTPETAFGKEVYIYKDSRCELAYGKSYSIEGDVHSHGGTSFPEMIDRTGKYRFGVRVKYVGQGDLDGENLISGCISLDEFEIIPTEINSASELQSFLSAAVNTNLESLTSHTSYKRHFKLIQDIDLSQGDTDCSSISASTSDNWTPITNFNGTLDGNGKNICGLYLNKSEDLVGFFETLGKESLIYNLGFIGSTIKNSSTNTKSAVGILAGESLGKIERISLTNYAGGAPINSSVIGNYNVGGLVGKSNGARIKKVESYADVTCFTSDTSCNGHGVAIGGIVGSIEAPQTINTTDFDNSNNVDYVESYTGHGVVLNSMVHAEVRGNSQVGGIVGVSEGLVMYSYVANKNANSGSPGLGVTGNDKVGGIAGEILNESNYNYGVMYSVAVVDVVGSTNTAGVIGLAGTSWAVHVSYHSSPNCYNNPSTGVQATCHSGSSITKDDFRDMPSSNCYSVFKFDCEGTFFHEIGSFPTLRMNGLDGFPLGRGTREDPIVISSQDDWSQIKNSSKFRSLHISILPKDNFGNTVENITFIDTEPSDGIDQTFDYGLTLNGSTGIYDYFTGTFDGGYYSLIDLRQHTNSRWVGSILHRSAGEFKNLKLINSLVTCGQNDLADPDDDSISNQNDCAVISRSSIGSVFENLIFENVELRITTSVASIISANSFSNTYKNIVMRDSQINNTTGSGGYVGSLAGSGTNVYMSNIQAENLKIDQVAQYSGGLAGYLMSSYSNSSLVENVHVDLDLVISPKGCSRVAFGGIVGYGYIGTVVKNSSSSGHVRQVASNTCSTPTNSTGLGGVFGYSRHSFLLNSFSEVNINLADNGGVTGGYSDSENCAGGSGTVGGGPDFKVQNSFFIGSINCPSGSYGIGQDHLQLLKGGDYIDNNYWYDVSPDNASQCFPFNSSCLTTSSYTWSTTDAVLNFIKGVSSPSLFTPFDPSSPSSGGLGWDQNIWIQEGNSLPKHKLFNP